MLQLTRMFWDICRLKTGPQQLPTSYYLMVATVLAGIVVDSFATSILIPKLSAFDIAKTIIIYNILLLAAVYSLLKLLGFKERGIQTLTAIAGAGLMISLVLLPGLLTVNASDAEAKSYALFILIDNIWRISVNAHILKHALSIGLLMAMILSVCYLLFGILVADVLLPSQTP